MAVLAASPVEVLTGLTKVLTNNVDSTGSIDIPKCSTRSATSGERIGHDLSAGRSAPDSAAPDATSMPQCRASTS